MDIKEKLIEKGYEIGKYTYFANEPRILDWGNNAKLRIGKFCSISEDVKIFLNADHRIDWITTYPPYIICKDGLKIEGHPTTKGDVIIGNDVWIGAGASILSGIKIGDGAIIGTQAVVTKDIEPYTIVAGNPARFIKKRFNEEQIKKLLKIRWWDWPMEKIKNNAKLLWSNDIEKIISLYDSKSI